MNEVRIQNVLINFDFAEEITLSGCEVENYIGAVAFGIDLIALFRKRASK